MKLLLALLPLLSSAVFAADDAKEWITLFNGKDLSGWRHHGPVKKNNAWEVSNGVLINNLGSGKSGTDLCTERSFLNFTVQAEFLVPEGSNSGIYLRGRHEIQITGDYSKRKIGPAGNGAIWNVKSPDVYASKPSGEWQSIEATMIGDKVTVLLNGKQIHNEVALTKVTGGALDSNLGEPGPIMLQGRLGTVRFRNIRLKELPR